MGHVIDGNLSMPKNNCFLVLSMYWHVRSFIRMVFCEFVIIGLVQKSLESSLSISRLDVHFLVFGKRCAISARLLVRSYFFIYASRHRTGPLSGLRIGVVDS